MRVAVFSTKSYDEQFLTKARDLVMGKPHQFSFLKPKLELATAPLAAGHEAVCVFVNDEVDAPVLEVLSSHGVRLIALRCAGFNNVDLDAAARLGFTVARVPGYSPYAVAEHAVGMMLALNRHITRAWARVREGNFSLDGLLGFDLHGRTVSIIGMGRIGSKVAQILLGFGCRVLGYDKTPNDAHRCEGVEYVDLATALSEAAIISLHCPLAPETHNLINTQSISGMQPGVMLINTSRGGLLDTKAVITALKTGHIGYLGLDVYEEEDDLFFEDRSASLLQDDVFARLLTFPNVLVTGHQAFFTREALDKIALVTMENLTAFGTTSVVPKENLVVA
jgi:D-lactate dehydrogenase